MPPRTSLKCAGNEDAWFPAKPSTSGRSRKCVPKHFGELSQAENNSPVLDCLSPSGPSDAAHSSPEEHTALGRMDTPRDDQHRRSEHNSSESQPIPKRLKVKLACQECRDRKIRCDGGRPICPLVFSQAS